MAFAAPDAPQRLRRRTPPKDLKEDRMHFSFIGHNAMYFGGPGGLLRVIGTQALTAR